MSPLFSVPQSELEPVRTLLATGHYDGDFTGVEAMAAKNGSAWKGIKGSFEQLATAAGTTEIEGQTEIGKAIKLSLAGRTHGVLFSTEGTSEKALAMSRRQLVELAVALGVAQEENGEAYIPGDTEEEVIETLNGARGKRVRFSIKIGPKKKNGAVVTDADGNAVLVENTNHFWDPTKSDE